MKDFFKSILTTIIGIIPLIGFGQRNGNCLYIDPSILIVNCGEESRNKLSETVDKMNRLGAKVLVLDFIFSDKRREDSIFIRNMKCETPIILAMGPKSDSSYFNLVNCHNGPHSINGNERDNVEFLFPLVKYNNRLRDSFELLVLKYFDSEKYMRMKAYLSSLDLSKIEVKAKIEFNGDSFKCFNSIDIKNLGDLNSAFVKNKIVILGYFGLNPDIPLRKDKNKFAFRVPAAKGETRYMHSTLISANIISNLIRKEIRDSDLNEIKK